MAEDIRITILSENTSVREDLAAEYGLSVWIEADGAGILFDTGTAGAFAKNAEALGVDLSRTVHLCLSHGHLDHTGGIALALEHAPQALIHLHPDAVRPKYLYGGEDRSMPIGMPGSAIRALRAKTSRCLFMTGVTRITEHVFLTGTVPRKTAFERIVEPFTLDPEGNVPDAIPDDQGLWIESGEGLIVVLGCAHSGVVNTIEHIREKSGRKEIRAVIGGMHLLSADQETITKNAEALVGLRPGLVSPNHCTGEPACAYLKERFRDVFRPSTTGTVFTFPV